MTSRTPDQKSRSGQPLFKSRVVCACGAFKRFESQSCRRCYAIRTHPPTARELQCVRLYCMNVPVREIAGQLGISPKTVEEKLCKVKRKLKLNSTIALVHWCLRTGVCEFMA